MACDVIACRSREKIWEGVKLLGARGHEGGIAAASDICENFTAEFLTSTKRLMRSNLGGNWSRAVTDDAADLAALRFWAAFVTLTSEMLVRSKQINDCLGLMEVCGGAVVALSRFKELLCPRGSVCSDRGV